MKRFKIAKTNTLVQISKKIQLFRESDRPNSLVLLFLTTSAQLNSK